MNKEAKEEFNNSFNKYFNQLVGYFIYKGNGLLDYDGAEDLAEKTLIEFEEALEKKEFKLLAQKKLLFTIAKRIFADHCEYQKKHKTLSLEYKIRTKGDEEVELKEMLKMYDEKIESLFNEKLKKDKIWQVKRALSHPQKIIREIAIITLAPNLKKLKEKIKLRFPFVIRRYNEKGPNYEVLKRGEIISDKESKEMHCSFGLLLFKIAKKFNIKDTVGIQALKILLLSSNPWADWCLIGPTMTEKNYSKNPYKKDLRRRCHRSWFGGFSVLQLKGLKKVGKFLEYEKTKEDENGNPMPMATNEYIRGFYEIPDYEALKKQASRMRKRIKEYDKIIGGIIQKL